MFLMIFTELHGSNGPVHVESARFAPMLEHWLNAGKDLGYDIVDLNGYQTEGIKISFMNYYLLLSACRRLIMIQSCRI